VAELKIVRSDAVPAQNIRGLPKEAGQIKRVIATSKLFFNVDEVNPGFSPHSWHRHTKYRSEGVEVEYAADFEEIYFILSGTGVVQWKSESGEVRSQSVGPGDVIHMPADVVEHQLLNDGAEPIRLAVVGVPPPKRTSL
jgi:mannose-6-phosphate isomerase-like protein (cupin superfamily)